jgi:hypothetical protein
MKTKEIQEKREKFVKIGNDILEVSRGYGEIDPKYQHIFEYAFKGFLDCLKYIQEGENDLRIRDVEKFVFDKIFGNMQFRKPQNNQCNPQQPQQPQQMMGGFNPNEIAPGIPEGVNLDLLQELKSNVNDIRNSGKVQSRQGRENINKKSNKATETMDEFVQKIKEEYKAKE